MLESFSVKIDHHVHRAALFNNQVELNYAGTLNLHSKKCASNNLFLELKSTHFLSFCC